MSPQEKETLQILVLTFLGAFFSLTFIGLLHLIYELNKPSSWRAKKILKAIEKGKTQTPFSVKGINEEDLKTIQKSLNRKKLAHYIAQGQSSFPLGIYTFYWDSPRLFIQETRSAKENAESAKVLVFKKKSK